VPSNHAEDINAAEDALKGKNSRKINYRHVKRINKERKIMNIYQMYRKH